MSKVNKEMKDYIILIIVAALAFWTVNNVEVIFLTLETILKVLKPFILGGVIAFILNIPTTKIENFLSKYLKKKGYKVPIRIVSIIISLLFLVVIISFVALLLIPELMDSLRLLMESIPGLIETLQVKVLDLLDRYPEVQTQMKQFFLQQDNTSDIVSSILNYVINSLVGCVSGIISSFVTIFTAIIFSIYMVSQKEYLGRGAKKIVYAYFPERQAKKMVETAHLLNNTFNRFISGQCVEAIILGVIIFGTCILFRFPYALIIATLTTITALVPIFGAIVAMTVGAILIGINNPVQAIIFIIVFQVVQQIEGNFIYPRVVGKSVGLLPMWTLLAIIVGGNLFGIVGMLVGLPLASVAYSLIRNNVNDKLREKKIS